jgi:hypothetical protein
MNCPHCQKPLPENYSATHCPFCGESIAAKVDVVASSQNTPRKRFFWGWFFLVLAAPAILDFLLMSFFSNSDEALNLMALVTFGGSPIASLVSSILLVRGHTYGSRSAYVLMGFFMFILFLVVSFALCFTGCATASVLSGK